ncbi:hypothetical protein HKX48_005181 [Thoreauomyces humboldtii]|nr:hypothetical protein HKX48_005181 [Thoreauomyces humboldtii]
MTDPAIPAFCLADPDLCMEYALLAYRPSVAGNSIYMITFITLLGVHAFLGYRYRTYGYLIPVTMGLLGEVLGYVGRLMLHKNPFDMNNFLLYLVPITIAPALLTAGIYLCLGRIILVAGKEHSRLAPRTYTYLFVACDLVSLVLQSIGGAIASLATDQQSIDLGVHIMMAGLVSQVVSMALFLGLWGEFAWNTYASARRGSTNKVSNEKDRWATLRKSTEFTRFQISLAAATVCIFVRCIFRVSELAGGFSGAEANNQTLFMLLEGPEIITACALLAVYHPGRIFGADGWDATNWKASRRTSDPDDAKAGNKPIKSSRMEAMELADESKGETVGEK